VLVCTDCLSEGINLQELFDTVFHYDLLWNPTRHAQREGRVDRYGQPQAEVHTILYYGKNNPVDGMVMDVLLRKHARIRSSLGVSVPVPLDSERVWEAIYEGLLLRPKGAASQSQITLPGFDEVVNPRREAFHANWDQAVEQEKRSRTIYAQATIKPDEVSTELEAARRAVGSSRDLAWFVQTAVRELGGVAAAMRNRNSQTSALSVDGKLAIDLALTPRAFRDQLGTLKSEGVGRFTAPVGAGEWLLHRAHPLVEALAGYVVDTTIDPKAEAPIARRCGVMRTSAVTRRTTLLMLRARYHLAARRRDEHELLAEEALLLAFTGSVTEPVWLEPVAVESLLGAEPAGNVAEGQAREFLSQVLEGLPDLEPAIVGRLEAQAEALRDAHQRVRAAAAGTGGYTSVTAQLPFDLVGLYVYLPVPKA
jgi:hypothetical protein